MSSSKVAVVTGSNKGIGFAIVRALCKTDKFDGDVILTARNEELGQKAVDDLGKEGLPKKPKFHQLDITNTESISRLKGFLQSNYGGLDVLVNNAGMAYKMDSKAPFAEQAEMSCKTNFTGTLNVCNALFPLLRPHARVVNVSSMASQFAITKCSAEVRSQFLNKSITMEDLERLMQSFVTATKNGTHEKEGWPNSAYGTSKIGVTVMTFIHQRALNKDPREDIVVNACCPGYVATDMSSFKGTKTIHQGAETPVYLALLPPKTSNPKGDMVSEKKVVDFGK